MFLFPRTVSYHEFTSLATIISPPVENDRRCSVVLTVDADRRNRQKLSKFTIEFSKNT